MALTEFLLARIAEDEAEVGVLVDGVRDEGAGPNGIGWAEVGAISEVLMVSHSRVLAECEAKRRIVEMDETFEDAWVTAVRALAAVYADHPEFREEWRL